MNIGIDINKRKLLSGFYKDIERDIKTRIFWNNPIAHLAYRYAWNFRPERQDAGSNPLAVDVEIANGCNFRCVMCQQSTEWLKREDEHFMSWDTLRDVVEESKRIGVYSMKVNWRGESTLDPECGDKCVYIKKAGIHEVQMNTNASKLEPILNSKLIDGLDRIIFSCDGVSKETYNKIRRGGDFATFIKNVTVFRRMRDEKDKKLNIFDKRYGLPVIRINMAVMEQNHHEVEDFKVLFKGIADEVFFNKVYRPQGAKSEHNKGQHRTSKRLGCPQIWQRLIVDTEGNVMPCCVDYQEKIKLGNTSVHSLLEIWTKRASYLRTAHKAHRGRSIDGCKGCDNFALSSLDDDGKVVWTDAGREAIGTGC